MAGMVEGEIPMNEDFVKVVSLLTRVIKTMHTTNERMAELLLDAVKTDRLDASRLDVFETTLGEIIAKSSSMVDETDALANEMQEMYDANNRE